MVSFIGCDKNEDFDCGYNGDTILVLKNKEASIIGIDGRFFLRFEEAIITESMNLMDSIYSLLPCNLDTEYQVNGLDVIVSGHVKENPGYSSHNNYTDFFVKEIRNASS